MFARLNQPPQPPIETSISLATVYSVPVGGIVNYDFRIKMRKTAVVTIVAKGRDGTLYTVAKEIDVSIGGCGG